MILVTDGRSEAQATGSVIQSAASLRPIARALFTLLGGLAMILGAFRPWRADSQQLGVQIDAKDLVGLFGLDLTGLRFNGIDVDLLAQLISMGIGVAALGVVVMFGLTGRTGRLSRLAAFLGALIVVGVLVTFMVAGRDGTPAFGAVLVLAGCVAGYIGGKLVKR